MQHATPRPHFSHDNAAPLPHAHILTRQCSTLHHAYISHTTMLARYPTLTFLTRQCSTLHHAYISHTTMQHATPRLHFSHDNASMLHHAYVSQHDNASTLYQALHSHILDPTLTFLNTVSYHKIVILLLENGWCGCISVQVWWYSQYISV